MPNSPDSDSTHKANRLVFKPSSAETGEVWSDLLIAFRKMWHDVPIEKDRMEKADLSRALLISFSIRVWIACHGDDILSRELFDELVDCNWDLAMEDYERTALVH